ncbi:umecyanin-like protein [Cinnamomum micranthum f. kanehirae]|uniref:Umecyanin-like protein n=1 Tax=Cinnamomum micranthum f. kanehirae TaxID=337451 RepID=A0A443N4B1_9MAGN|nr:umecyanin-like protein [Cinnamomum micranthum f. kanehirae]
MASRMGLIGPVVVAVVVLAALLQCTAAQTTHVVGDSTGWRVPSGAQFYSNWANGQTFRVGDTLTFNFGVGQHDVAQVTKTNFDSCGTSNTIGSVIRTSPANIVLNSTGNFYFICTFSGHCNAGQKVDINVVSSSTTTPSTPTTGSSLNPSPAPTAGGTPNTSNSAASLAAGFGVSGIFVAILTAFFL